MPIKNVFRVIKNEEDNKKHNWYLDNKIEHKKVTCWEVGLVNKNEGFITAGENIDID